MSRSFLDSEMSGYGWCPPPENPGGEPGGLVWECCANGYVPGNAVTAGYDKDGGKIFVGRALHEGDIIPAKVTPTHGCAFVSWGGLEHAKPEYEVLCSDQVAWTNASNGAVPPNAVGVGTSRDGEKLYCGRVIHDGTLTPGKVHPSHGCLYIPFDGKEVRFDEYEVLVVL